MTLNLKKFLSTTERKHLPPNEKKLNDLHTVEELSQDNGHLVLDPALFKSYFSAMAKNKYDDIEKLLNGIKIKEQNLNNVNFMNIGVQAKISKKVDVTINAKDKNADVKGMPILITFIENDISATFEAVSATYEVSNEQGSVVFNKFPINVTVSLALDPTKQILVTEIQSVDFDLKRSQ